MKSYHSIDKTAWGPGPWQDEPDKLSWTDEATGLPCLIVRNLVGALCGYVGVLDDHPWHGFHYDKANELDIEVHGGLTFANECDTESPQESSICHIPEPGEPDDVWWFGFDCAHHMDYMPQMATSPFGYHTGVYRTVDYVRAEVARLAMQLAEHG